MDFSDEVKESLDNYIDWIIGEDYVFDRPKEDYLPNVYLYLKAKNELRAEQRERAGIKEKEPRR